jgi:serine phosphatase RsbU (regulator of sigma subunit)
VERLPSERASLRADAREPSAHPRGSGDPRWRPPSQHGRNRRCRRVGLDHLWRTFKSSERRLRSGERLILLSDRITERRMTDGATFEVDALKGALRAESPTAACTAMAIQRAVTDGWQEPLQDDATVVVMAIA